MLLMAASLMISCSKDKNDGSMSGANAIIGTWVVTELKIDNATATDEEKTGRDILNYLNAVQCYVITFKFNEDLTVVADNSVNYLEINVNAGGTGLDIPCPTQKDTENSTYTYDGKVLSVVDAQGMTVSTNATIEGTIMTVDALGLDIPNLNTGGQLIFKKQ